MNARATNNALLKVLGITEPLITALQIQMHPTNLPVVTIEYLLDGKALEPTAAQFDLVLREEPEPAPAPAPAFDLDAMCADARQSVRDIIEVVSGFEMGQQLKESRQIRQRLREACDLYHSDAKQAIGRLELDPMLACIRRLAASGALSTLGGWNTLGGVSSPGLFTGLADRFESIGSTLGGARK